MVRTYSIGDTAKITKVSMKQLRHWEKRNYLSGIKRSICGERAYRRYSNEQINQIKKIKEYLDTGFTLQAASRLTKKNTEKGGE